MSFGNTPHSIENRRKTLLIYTFAGLGTVFLLSFGTLSLVQGRYFLGGVLLCVNLAIVTLSLLVSRLQSVQPVSLALSAILVVLAPYLVLTGGVQGTGVYWSYMITMLMVMLVGPKAGLAYLAVYMTVIVVGLYSGLPWVYEYSSEHVVRILATSVSLQIVLIASEWIRVMSYGAITFTSESHRHLANTDSLTGTLNRAGVKTKLDDLGMNAEASIALIDIDHFKVVNDRYGHDAGDKALIHLSEILKTNTKGKDLVARWGGEEFLLVFPDTSVGSAQRLVDDMRGQLERFSVQYGEHLLPLTFSGGVAEMTKVENFERAVKAADDKLYKAKASGRNRVLA